MMQRLVDERRHVAKFEPPAVWFNNHFVTSMFVQPQPYPFSGNCSRSHTDEA